MTETPGRPYFYVELLMANLPEGGSLGLGCVYALRVELNQQVVLKRDPAVRFFPGVATWASNMMGVASKGSCVKAVRGTLDDLVDEFSNDYLAANPKE